MSDTDRVASTMASELLDAKRTAWGLAYADRLPGAVPDFASCGGPAAQAYWDYFTPARLLAYLTALGAVLDLARKYDLAPEGAPCANCHEVAAQFRDVIRDEMEQMEVPGA